MCSLYIYTNERNVCPSKDNNDNNLKQCNKWMHLIHVDMYLTGNVLSLFLSHVYLSALQNPEQISRSSIKRAGFDKTWGGKHGRTECQQKCLF